MSNATAIAPAIGPAVSLEAVSREGISDGARGGYGVRASLIAAPVSGPVMSIQVSRSHGDVMLDPRLQMIDPAVATTFDETVGFLTGGYRFGLIRGNTRLFASLEVGFGAIKVANEAMLAAAVVAPGVGAAFTVTPRLAIVGSLRVDAIYAFDADTHGIAPTFSLGAQLGL